MVSQRAYTNRNSILGDRVQDTYFTSGVGGQKFSRTMPIDINWIRPDRGGNPDVVRQSEERRGRDPAIVDRILEIDDKWRKEMFNMEGVKKAMNEINKKVADKKKKNREDPCTEEVNEMSKLKVVLAEKEKTVEEVSNSRDKLLHTIGNIVHESVPVSKTEDENLVVRRWGTPNRMKIDGTPGRMFHHQILEKLRGFDPVKGAQVAGHRGYYLKGVGVLLNMALQQYGISFLGRKGYLPVQPPYFMKKEIMAATAELKDFEETLYRIPGSEAKEDYFMIATSEQPISALHMDDYIDEKELPIKYAGISSCFRKEAGERCM
jgi:seryl-tRNA synthetase